MQPRRQLTDAEFKLIIDYPPPDKAVRFSKKKLLELGFPQETLDQGGLVRINKEIYSFVMKENDSKKSHILGEGTYGRVKLLQNVKDPEDQKALKVLFANGKPVVKSQTEDYQEFVRELQISIALERGSEEVMEKAGENGHTSFCGVLDVIPGMKLNDYLKANKKNPNLTLEKRLKILLLCMKELQWLHNKNFVHRDLHAGNFMYDEKTDTVKIIDFGRANKLPSSTEELSQKEALVKSDLSDFAQFINSFTWNDMHKDNKLNDTEKEKINNLMLWMKMDDLDSEIIMTMGISQLEDLVSGYSMRQAPSLTHPKESKEKMKESANDSSIIDGTSPANSEVPRSLSSKQFIKRSTSQSLPQENFVSTDDPAPVHMHVKRR